MDGVGQTAQGLAQTPEDLRVYDKAVDVNTKTQVREGAVTYERDLLFEDYLQIIYLDELEDRQYVFDVYANRREAGQYQASWTRMADSTVTFDILGNLKNAASLIQQGYFFWDARMANMIPLDYILPSLEKTSLQ